MPYGSTDENVKEENIDVCIGYIVQNENISSIVDESNTDTRIYTLIDDPEHNYLMDYNIEAPFLNDFVFFWRAVDTKGEDINMPEYITSDGDAYWGE